MQGRGTVWKEIQLLTRKLSLEKALSPHGLCFQLMSALQKHSSYSWASFQNLQLRKVQKLGCCFVLVKVKTWISSTAINDLCVEDKSLWVNHEHTLLFKTKMLWLPTGSSPFRGPQLLHNAMSCLQVNDRFQLQCLGALLVSEIMSRKLLLQSHLHFQLPCWLVKYLKIQYCPVPLTCILFLLWFQD